MTLKLWQIIALVIVAFSIGAMYPAPFNTVRSKLTGGAAA